MSLRWPSKDPDEVLDYSIDWSRFLGSNTITAVSWYFYDENDVKTLAVNGQTVDGLTAGPQAATSTVATIILEDGTLNKEYRVTCAITFGSGLVAERTVRLQVREN
jgi:hypothetical protein